MTKNLQNGGLLREFEVGDKQGLIACMSDPDVVQYTEWDAMTEASAAHLIAWAMSTAAQEPRQAFAYAIVEPGGNVIGCATLMIRDAGARQADLGIIIGKSYWGLGHGTTVARALLTIGFEDLGQHRIVARTDPANAGMQAVARKVGMVLEGHLRECVFEKECWRDRLVFSMLDYEYNSGLRG